MTDFSWDGESIDSETHRRALAEAERLGLSLSDYLANIVFEEQDAAGEPASSTHDLRYRLDSFERRIRRTLGATDNTLLALDNSVVDLADRVAEAESLAQEAAKTTQTAARDLAEHCQSLRQRQDNAEREVRERFEAGASAQRQIAQRAEQVSDRVDSVEDIARGAQQSVAFLAEAHEALRTAVAEDLSALSQETALQFAQGLDAVRAEADAASARADAAAQQLLGELAGFRQSLDAQVEARVDEVRGRFEALFAELAEAHVAAHQRLDAQEQALSNTADDLRNQIAHAEIAGQEALTAATRDLAAAQDATAKNLARADEEQRARLASLKIELSAEVTELRVRDQELAAKIEAMKEAEAVGASDMARLQEMLTLSEAALHDRLAGLETQSGALSTAIAQTRDAGADNVTRVEACMMAALEKLSDDIILGDEDLASKLEAVAGELHDQRATQHKLDTDLSRLRGEHSGALARLHLIDRTLGNLADPGDIPVVERLAALEHEMGEQVARLVETLDAAETEQALTMLSEQVNALAVRVNERRVDDALAQKVDDLRARLATQEIKAAQANHRVQGLAMNLGRLTTQSATLSAQSEERLSKVEKAVAERGADANASLQRRLAELESRQSDSFATLRRELALFIEENERRLAAIEDGGAVAPVLESFAAALDERFQSIEGRDLASDFENLRLRIEERVVGVEERSVHALEQLSDTVAMIERRLLKAVEGGAKQAS